MLFRSGVFLQHFLVALDCRAHDDRLGNADVFVEICLFLICEGGNDKVAEYVCGQLPVFTGDHVELAADLRLFLDSEGDEGGDVAEIFAADCGKYRIGCRDLLGDSFLVCEFQCFSACNGAGVLGIA